MFLKRYTLLILKRYIRSFFTVVLLLLSALWKFIASEDLIWISPLKVLSHIALLTLWFIIEFSFNIINVFLKSLGHDFIITVLFLLLETERKLRDSRTAYNGTYWQPMCGDKSTFFLLKGCFFFNFSKRGFFIWCVASIVEHIKKWFLW